MEKLKEIYVFVAFLVGVGCLLLAAFQAYSGNLKSFGALGMVAVVCGIFLFLSQIKTFKVWQIEVELRETLDRAEEIIGRVRRLAAISARASYLTIAWGNRLGTPSAKEKQAVLDDIDAQLSDLKVTPAERAVIVKPWIKMVKADFFYAYTRVVKQFATLKASSLTAQIHATQSKEAHDASMAHSELITPWSKKTNADFKAMDRLEVASLSAVIDDWMPGKGGWLSDKELAAIELFKREIVKLNDDCEKKGGYTSEAANYYDRFSDQDKAKELWDASRK